MTADTQARPGIRGFIKLGIGIFLIWVAAFHAGPALINAIPTWKSLGEAADRLDINTGAIFYTDVPVAREAEMQIRSTIRYQPGKK
ncbi:hypothetical protein LJC23_06620 [Desulfovibrio sp. OttesenSCG-928-I05]|nr:hypothetical protein [Desulfovibrio sp. OttesenSCG-928-I05]